MRHASMVTDDYKFSNNDPIAQIKTKLRRKEVKSEIVNQRDMV